MSDAREMKSSLTSNVTKPPLPTASPASRYRGTGGMPRRSASRASTARPMATAPSSMNASGVFPVVAARTEITSASSERSCASPSGVPTATATSPASITKSGPGAGIVCCSRMTATIDVPVSASVLPVGDRRAGCRRAGRSP